MRSKFTLVIPTYNEAEIISDTLDVVCGRFADLTDADWKIIVADNASTDKTADIVEARKDPHVGVIRLKEKGRGRAVRAGFAAAGGGIVAFTDSDLSVSPEEIIVALRKVDSDECDIVIGDRFSGRDHAEGRKWWRNGSSTIFRIFARVIVGIHANDMQCPLKMANERSIPVMLATVDNTWFNDLEFIALAERSNLRIFELPVKWDEGRYPNRKSKLKLFQDGFRAIWAMFEIRKRLAWQLVGLKGKLP